MLLGMERPVCMDGWTDGWKAETCVAVLRIAEPLEGVGTGDECVVGEEMGMGMGMKSVGFPGAGLLSRGPTVSIRVRRVGRHDHEGNKRV